MTVYIMGDCSTIGVSLPGNLCIDWNFIISFLGIVVICIAIEIVLQFLRTEPWNMLFKPR
jgi:hypothetical protein